MLKETKIFLTEVDGMRKLEYIADQIAAKTLFEARADAKVYDLKKESYSNSATEIKLLFKLVTFAVQWKKVLTKFESCKQFEKDPNALLLISLHLDSVVIYKR